MKHLFPIEVSIQQPDKEELPVPVPSTPRESSDAIGLPRRAAAVAGELQRRRQLKIV